MSRPLAAVRSLSKKITAPLISQGITAGGSLLLQIVAARTLGLSAYGSFAVCLSLLVAATALYSGYVGDSLAVLDRHDDDTRATLCASALVLLLVAFVVAFGTVIALLHSVGAALVYAVMVVLWLVEETFRRVLIARLQFWRLVANDGTYAAASLLAVLVLWLTGVHLSLGHLFAAMGVGALLSVVLGILQVPAHERRRLRPGWAAMREVASFAAWRSAHAALRPTALLVVRMLVANLLSLSAVGMLEAARLVVAPLQVIINGAGSFLLASFAAAEHGRGPSIRRLARNSAWMLLAITLGCGTLLAIFAAPAGQLMTGHPVPPLLVFGWVVYLAVWAVGLPYVTEVVARRLSRAVFLARLVDSVLGLAFVFLLLRLGFGLTGVPWLMAAGGLYAVWRIFRLAIRTRPATHGTTPAQPVTSPASLAPEDGVSPTDSSIPSGEHTP